MHSQARMTLIHVPTASLRIAPQRRFYGTVQAIAMDCSAALVAREEWELPELGQSSTLSKVHVFWVRLDGSGNDTVGVFAGREAMVIGDRRNLRYYDWQVRPMWRSDGRVVYYGPGDRPEVRVLRGSRLVRIIRWDAQRRPMSEGEWEYYESVRQHLIAHDPGTAQVYLPRNGHPRAEEPKPLYDEMMIDELGYIWVRQTMYPSREMGFERRLPHPQRWWIFDREGRWLGDIETPARLQIVDLGDEFLLGVSEDEYGVEMVQSHRIRRSGPVP